MLPLSDGVPTRRFPIVNTLLIVANVAVWLFYELPGIDSAVAHASLYPCTVLYPNARVLGLLIVFPVRVSAWFFLAAWFLYQLIEANVGLLTTAPGDSGGVAVFAHVGGFVFGYVVARVLSHSLSRPPSPS